MHHIDFSRRRTKQCFFVPSSILMNGDPNNCHGSGPFFLFNTRIPFCLLIPRHLLEMPGSEGTSGSLLSLLSISLLSVLPHVQTVFITWKLGYNMLIGLCKNFLVYEIQLVSHLRSMLLCLLEWKLQQPNEAETSLF